MFTLRLRVLLAAVLVCVCLPASAWASEIAKLRVRFSPDTLGGTTTILVDFELATPTGQIPSPVTDVSLRLPDGMSLGTTTLGIDACDPRRLESQGPSGCPSNALMGFGKALVAVPTGPEPVYESADISIFMVPPTNYHTTMLFYADGESPVSAQIVFPSVLFGYSQGPFAADLNTVVPLTPTWPGGPYTSLTRMHSSLGPLHLTYYKRVHGKLVHFRPEGIAIPKTCPIGGFPFAAVFSFQDGTTAAAASAVACPHRLHHRK
jgi:hypothetical protein